MRPAVARGLNSAIGRKRLRIRINELPFFRQEFKIPVVAGFIPMAGKGYFWPLAMLQEIEWLDDSQWLCGV